MRALVKVFRFLLQIQGAILTSVDILPDWEAIGLKIRRHGNAVPHCGRCGTRLTGRVALLQRQWRHLDMMMRRTYLNAQIREGYCAHCGGRRVEGVPWAAPGAHHTKDFDHQVARLAQVADKTAVSRMFDVNWRTVGRMIKRVVEDKLPKDLLKGLRAIGVDETSYKRNHRYLTVVTDLMTGRVIWIGKGKSAATLGEFFTKLGTKRSRALELVTMDMSGGYEKAVRGFAPNAEIVFDRFHVVKLLTDAIDEIRREECRDLEPHERRSLKNIRFSLLRNPRNHTPRDKEAIHRVEKSNQRLFRAYQHRVDFERLWEYTSPSAARRFLMRWTRGALLSRRDPLKRFAKTLRKHIDGILGYIGWGWVTNAGAEGMNNKIKLLIHKAYGFHSTSALMSMIYLCCSGITL